MFFSARAAWREKYPKMEKKPRRPHWRSACRCTPLYAACGRHSAYPSRTHTSLAFQPPPAPYTPSHIHGAAPPRLSHPTAPPDPRQPYPTRSPIARSPT